MNPSSLNIKLKSDTFLLSVFTEPNNLLEVGGFSFLFFFCFLLLRKEIFDLRENNEVREASSPNAQMSEERWI